MRWDYRRVVSVKFQERELPGAVFAGANVCNISSDARERLVLIDGSDAFDPSILPRV